MKVKPLVTAVRLGIYKLLGLPMTFNIVLKDSKGKLRVEKYPIYEKR